MPRPRAERHPSRAGRRVLLSLRRRPGPPAAAAQAARGRADPKGVRRQDRGQRVFSTYRADSYVRRQDRGELDLDQCPPVVAEVLDPGCQAQAVSDGAFSTLLPDPAEPGRRRLDPSGVVDGWAADRGSVHLAGLDDTDFCLSAGGDIVCRAVLGHEPWRIGIEDPHDPSHVVAVVPLRQGAVAPSGTAHRGAQLVDARTGRPPVGVSSVTVINPSLTWADIDATAAYALGAGAAGWLRTRPIASALVVTPDGRATTVVPDVRR